MTGIGCLLLTIVSGDPRFRTQHRAWNIGRTHCLLTLTHELALPFFGLASGTMIRRIKSTVFIICFVASVQVRAESDADLVDSRMASLLTMSLQELGQVQVSTPSGMPRSIDHAAAVVTVITRHDIEAIGSNDLMDVLETVPGLHVGRSEQGALRKPMIRGITSSLNPQTLVMVNGIPLTTNVMGNRSNALGSVPLRSVERIEIIRGPGSALYGADAYAGVVNILTMSPSLLLKGGDATAVVAGVSVGSFGTRGGWMQSAYDGEVDAAVFVEYQETDGYRREIPVDAQSAFDSAFGTQVSLAPGQMNNQLKEGLLRWQIEGEHWRLRSGFQSRPEQGTGAGVNLALDPHGNVGGYRVNVDHTYTRNDLLDDVTLESRLSFLRTTQKIFESLWLFPPGAFGGAFPEGFSGNPGFKEDQARLDLSAVYRGLDRHWLRVGAGFQWSDLFETTETRNFVLQPNGSIVPLPYFVDNSDNDAT